MTNLYSVKAYILTEATYEDIEQIIQTLKVAREMLSQQQRRTLKKGQSVKFTARGVDYTGTITSIRLKRAVVQLESGVIYTVPLNMLNAI